MRTILIDYLPLIGTRSFWQSIKKADAYIMLDREVVPYGWNKYLGVEIPLNSQIENVDFEDIKICNSESSWMGILWNVMDNMYHKTPHFKFYREKLKQVISGRYYIKLFNYYHDIFVLLDEFLYTNTPVLLQSGLPFLHQHFTDRLVNIAKYTDAENVILPYYFEQEVQKVKFQWEDRNVSFYDRNLESVLEVLFSYGVRAGKEL